MHQNSNTQGDKSKTTIRGLCYNVILKSCLKPEMCILSKNSCKEFKM